MRTDFRSAALKPAQSFIFHSGSSVETSLEVQRC